MHPRFDPLAQPPSTPPPSGRESPDATLTRLRERLAAPTPEAYAEAARYLAFRGTGWENPHRYEVAEILQAHAAEAAPAILAKASAFPRADVCDAAADALDPLVTTAEGVAVLARHYHADPSPGVQRVCACAFGRATGAAAVAAAREALLAAVASADEDRRENAEAGLATLRLRANARAHLTTANAVTELRIPVVCTTVEHPARPGDVSITVLPLRSIGGTVRLAGDDTPGNTMTRTAADTSAPAAHSTPPRRTLDAATIAEALAAHPTRSAAAAALGVDTSYLRRLARRLGVAWPEADRAPGSAGGAWAGDNRREAAREWMRRRRAARATRKGTAEGGDGGEAPEGRGHA